MSLFITPTLGTWMWIMPIYTCHKVSVEFDVIQIFYTGQLLNIPHSTLSPFQQLSVLNPPPKTLPHHLEVEICTEDMPARALCDDHSRILEKPKHPCYLWSLETDYALWSHRDFSLQNTFLSILIFTAVLSHHPLLHCSEKHGGCPCT